MRWGYVSTAVATVNEPSASDTKPSVDAATFWRAATSRAMDVVFEVCQGRICHALVVPGAGDHQPSAMLGRWRCLPLRRALGASTDIVTVAWVTLYECYVVVLSGEGVLSG